tara:strand:+ start:19 stop:366 length:348 start_codon:yes stop_codon:yes gene_type:complete
MQVDSDQPSAEIDVQQVKARLDSGETFLLLDCREQDEYDFAHIESAVLVPMSQLQERVSELDPHRTASVVVYCHLGGRSLQVTHWLRQQGFEDVVSMAGGIDAWSQQIDPQVPRY